MRSAPGFPTHESVGGAPGGDAAGLPKYVA